MSVTRYEFELYHCNGGEMLVSDTGDYVSYEDYATLEQKLAESQRELRAADATIENLQMQLEKMAAENALMKKSEPAPFSKLMMEALDVYQAGADEVPELAMLSAYTKLRDGLKTPATDAFLAEVWAQGADAAIEELNQLAERSEKEAPIAAEHHRSAALYLQLLATQLRKGVQS
ncbi:hypothetical protein NVS08_20080 [Enterobacter kobei]|uniref:hypothetical protein n=1 Tax=Enterobacter kobei TaxID=208224 RepID=UPI00254C541E|nr:hypothetical protein [Enterobacter kobei]MDK9887848.1 hypothetical protein [Enterobacter kobei]